MEKLQVGLRNAACSVKMLSAVSGFRDGTELMKWRLRIVLKVTSLRVYC